MNGERVHLGDHRVEGQGVTAAELAVKLVDGDHAAEAVAILREAAAWARSRGIEVWRDDELRVPDFAAAAHAGELVMGFEAGAPAATMLLQSADTLYWPEVAAGTTLFLHKIAVRRAQAGRGWLARLTGFAEREAHARGLGWLRLDTLHDSALRGLYERLGFIRLDEPPLHVGGRTLIRMERGLCPYR